MDVYEATQTVMSRIQALDPENASKIMGYILIQDQGDKEMIRLAFSPDPLLLSYISRAKARLGFPSNCRSSNPPPPFSNPALPSTPFPENSPEVVVPNSGGFLPSNPYGSGVLENDLGDEYRFPFLDNPAAWDPVMNPGGRSDSLVFPNCEEAGGVSSSPQPHPFHKRSYSVNDAAYLSTLDEGGLWRPCMYCARGFCKDGGGCKFGHGEFCGGFAPVDVGSPGRSVSGLDELLRIKALQQQRLAFMAAGGRRPFAYNKCMDAIYENLRSGFFGLSASADSSARQIYLTFPADSTFKDDDVSNYFSMFGPVQDVRIPYQQKRMFGFVAFVYPETVELILAKGNPHFVCDSRVLVKPYKEKGTFKEKKQQQQHRLSPSELDIGENFDTPFGPRMLLSPREMMLRGKMEQEAEMQQGIELQGRRMMDLQLMDPNNENHNFHRLQRFPAEFDGGKETAIESDDKLMEAGDEESSADNTTNGDEEKLNRGNSDDSVFHESVDCSLEHALPENLFNSPTKSGAENRSCVFSQHLPEANDSEKDLLSGSSSPLTIASLKSCYLQMPRFSSGREVVEM
ncbi:Zinc finger CCCH domain-containing protein 46 [Striga hermonthica]|uniref:Zinc finger CCCH domain-containing protein 46 n=1 Tax=Striga hermonthica TaxID=68872 RepID=A0A9N7R1J8_STRHE|nr:Zinc finger CCCH domain-containing protein 46 [Striga hermonthica]